MAFNTTTYRTGPARNLKAQQRRMEKILDCLGTKFKPWPQNRGSKFLLLVKVILSQNTNDHNSFAAFDKLVSKFRTPEQIANANLREIQKLIRVGGLYKEKSKRLKEVSKVVLEKYGGDISSILRKPTKEAREELLQLPGVGFKTADVVLAFGAGRDVFPVDTHVFRLSKRLGFAEREDDYEDVKKKLEEATPFGGRLSGHVLFIQLGRTYCRARKPMHSECPINSLCPNGTRRAKP